MARCVCQYTKRARQMRAVEMTPLLVRFVCGRAGMLSILRATATGNLTSIVRAEKQWGLKSEL
jgi:hypothetical protein